MTETSVDQAPLAELARDFWWNGVAVLRGLISEELVDDVRREIDELYQLEVNRRAGRVQDAWEIKRGTREVATAAELLEALQFLYGRRPIPYQTLNFLHGSEQRAHTDCWHAGGLPSGFVCSAWTAIDETDSGNGPLFCYPGSHHLEELTPQHLAPTPEDLDTRTYLTHQESLMRSLGYERREIHAHPGDVVIFAGNLVHGGCPILDTTRTRRSVVTQYLFEGCVYFTPRRSDIAAGELALRDSLIDITTGRRVKHSYNGRPVAYYKLRNGRGRVYLDAGFRQRTWALLREAGSLFPHKRARISRAREQRYRQQRGETVRLR